MEHNLSQPTANGPMLGLFPAALSLVANPLEATNQEGERKYILRRKNKIVSVDISTVPSNKPIDLIEHAKETNDAPIGGNEIFNCTLKSDAEQDANIEEFQQHTSEIKQSSDVKESSDIPMYVEKKKRGRPKKIIDTASVLAPVMEKRKRGRPKKISMLGVTSQEVGIPRKRGRPKKIKSDIDIQATGVDISRGKSTEGLSGITDIKQIRKRGRPKKMVETVSPQKPMVITGKENIVIRTKPTYRMIVLDSGPTPKRGRKKEMPMVQERWGFMNRFTGYIQDEFFRRKTEAIAWIEKKKEASWISIEKHSELVLIKVDLNIKEVGNTKLELLAETAEANVC